MDDPAEAQRRVEAITCDAIGVTDRPVGELPVRELTGFAAAPAQPAAPPPKGDDGEVDDRDRRQHREERHDTT